MKKWILRLYENDVFRYIFFGGCTTLVNLISFYVLRCLGMELNLANTISIVAAILFAYVVNSRFVFRDQVNSWKEHLIKMGKFFGARLSTMVIEIGGVWFLVEILSLSDMTAKFVIQFIVLVLNYLFSKFLVFK